MNILLIACIFKKSFGYNVAMNPNLVLARIRYLFKIYNRKTTIPKTMMNKIKPTVIKKFCFNSGNISVSRIPFVSITGFTA